jgi:hypothetical protein
LLPSLGSFDYNTINSYNSQCRIQCQWDWTTGLQSKLLHKPNQIKWTFGRRGSGAASCLIPNSPDITCSDDRMAIRLASADEKTVIDLHSP